MYSFLSKISCVVMANGERPQHPVAIQLLRQANTLVCCDGAVRHLVAMNLQPTVIVGDGDSLTTDELDQFSKILCFDKSQEYNDLTKSFHYCLAQKISSIAIVGGCGLREDHMLANLSIMMRFSSQIKVCMVTNYGIFTPIHSTTLFESYQGEQVSVFSFSPQIPLTFIGLKYPVEHRSFLHLWEGALNESLGNQFSISFDKGDILVYQAFQKENR